ncbi:hypothetical protein HM1_0496 [Heliomicrobium modesticaldum Ice1]|uniref:Uncharacterized protein n=1 Tax=Heliobacterium modesticaldum (strain ATCC 51547 / Ice1) TaxID=498761 RepID=B0TFL1_HELMI|nr:hypothetical protein [Heliomicrobium modesticaldum]ABZ83110.1 hypothetical protein HM1_0496 [Heliomicrobium modesticaldum Ice1]
MIISKQKAVILTCRACRERFELSVKGVVHNEALPHTVPLDVVYIGSTHYVADESHAMAEILCVCPNCSAKNKFEAWIPRYLRL